ncbi:MAG: WD40 repeat domain-containing protein [Planctomycetota bacterium]|nr:WD40 repeat domain-containing protein [Planctomycetota bacterium]MDA1212285.1 WD40 repeat domain-containing protein [Planctomycetota bacterium]
MRVQQTNVFLLILISTVLSMPKFSLSEPVDNKTTPGVTLREQSEEAAFSSITFSPDRDDVACVDLDGTVLIWDVRTGKAVKTLRPTASHPYTHVFGAMAFSPDGKTIASGNAGAIVLWDRKTGKERSILNFQDSDITSLAFALDGNCLAIGTTDGMVHLWDLVNGQLRASLAGQEDGVYMVAFSPDAKILAIPDKKEGQVSLWDVATGQKVKTLNHSDSLVAAIFFSQDGKTLICSSGYKTGFWDVASGARKHELDVPVYSPQAIAFSPDGLSLAVGGGDFKDLDSNDYSRMCSVRVLDVKTGRCLRRLDHHTKPVISVAYSHDGKRLATTSWDGSVRLWTLDE